MKAPTLQSIAIAAAISALATVSACKENAPSDTAQPPSDDRTLQKLKAEVDRANRGESVGHAPNTNEDPNANLAGLAVGDQAPKTLKLPEKNETGWVGDLAVKLAQVTAMHSVHAGKLAITTEDAFLQVNVATQNTGKAPVNVDLGLAQVIDGAGHSYGIATDAQRAAGTRTLAKAYAPDERQDVTLYFEVPPAVVGHGLKLKLPAGVAARATSDLEVPLD